MRRRLQFGMRENPASDRRHGSRSAESTLSTSRFVEEGSIEPLDAVALGEPAVAGAHSPVYTAEPPAATGKRNTNQNRLLTVHEVADLLQVPTSWVYEHTRHRCVHRIPGIRLGKYWRFERTDVEAWIDANRRKDYSRVG